MTAFGGITKDLYALPPRGVTKGQARIGDRVLHQWTYLCEKNDCHAVGYSTDSEESARKLVDGHTCPAPMRRGMIPMGKSLLEKMWDEADDALDALKAGTFHLTEDLKGEKLRGYISGIAECISFCALPYFRITEDVLREMNRRWKMRQGIIPFSPTPSYRYNPPPVEYLTGQRGEMPRPNVRPAAVKKASKAVPAATKPAWRNFTDDEATLIRESHESGVPLEDLAVMFSVTKERIAAVVSTHKQDVVMPELF